MRTAPHEVQMSNGTPCSMNAFPTMTAELARAWVDWLERLMQENQLPLSGDVSQWISAWGEAVGQIGLLNINTVGSPNPQLERSIGRHYSYGRQIGRMLDVLTPLVAANEALLQKEIGKKNLAEFNTMVSDIQTLKASHARTTDDIVRDVQSWHDHLPADQFKQRLQALRTQLDAIAPHT